MISKTFIQKSAALRATQASHRCQSTVVLKHLPDKIIDEIPKKEFFLHAALKNLNQQTWRERVGLTADPETSFNEDLSSFKEMLEEQTEFIIVDSIKTMD